MAIQDDKLYSLTGEQLKDFAKRGGGADWEQEDPAGAGYIKHRPFYDTRFTFPYFSGETTMEYTGSVPIDGMTWESDPQAYASKLGFDFYSEDVLFFKVDSSVLFEGEQVRISWKHHRNDGMEMDNDSSGTFTATVSIRRVGTEQKEFFVVDRLLIADDVACFRYGNGWRDYQDTGDGNSSNYFYTDAYYYQYDCTSLSGRLHTIESKFLPKGTSNARGAWSLTELDAEIRREEILDQADWNAQSSSSPAFIRNKPFKDTSVVYNFYGNGFSADNISTNYSSEFRSTSFYQLYGRVIPCYGGAGSTWNYQDDSFWNWASNATSDKWETLTVGETFDLSDFVYIEGNNMYASNGQIVKSFVLNGQTYTQLTGTQKRCKLATFEMSNSWGESTTGYLFITPTAVLLAKPDDWYWDNASNSAGGTLTTHGTVTTLNSKYLPSAGKSSKGVASYTEMSTNLKGTYLKAADGKLDLRDSHIADWNTEYDTDPTFVANRPFYTDTAGHRSSVAIPYVGYTSYGGNGVTLINPNHYYGTDLGDQAEFCGTIGTDYYRAGYYALKADSALLAQLKTAAETGQAINMTINYSYHTDMDWSSSSGTVSERFVFEKIDDNIYVKPFDKTAGKDWWSTTQVCFGRWADVGTDLSANTPEEDDWIFAIRLSGDIGNGNIDEAGIGVFEIEALTDTVYQLDAKYIPVDGTSVYVENGVLKSAGGGGGGGVSPEVLANYYTKTEIDDMFANLEVVTDVEF